MATAMLRAGVVAGALAVSTGQSHLCVGSTEWAVTPEPFGHACVWEGISFMTHDQAVAVCEKKVPGGWSLPTVDQANALLTKLTRDEQIKFFPLSPTNAKVCNPGVVASGPNCNEWLLGAGQWGGFNAIQCDSKVCQSASDDGTLNYLVRCVRNNSATCTGPQPPPAPPPPTPEVGYWCVNSTACLHGPRPGPGYHGGTEAQCRALCHPARRYRCKEGHCVVSATGGSLKECTDVC